MSGVPDRPPEATQHSPQELRKRPRLASSDARYPRKRSSKACHVCRARKTKCDNVRPTCGFCASLDISCSYDDVERDHSAFDPASLEILRKLGEIQTSQDTLLHLVQSSAAGTQPQHTASPASHSQATHAQGNGRGVHDTLSFDRNGGVQHLDAYLTQDWFGEHPDWASASPAASTGVAAVQWFGLLTKDASLEAHQEAEVPSGSEGNFLDPLNTQYEGETTPLQRATRNIDGQPVVSDSGIDSGREQDFWQAPESIALLGREQILFENFLHRICPWLDLFDTARTFSTIVPRLAARNAGLLNAILALSCYHHSLEKSVPSEEQADQNSALQYYYQSLHYVQKAMHYSTYQHSLELMATTLIISTYEMFRGSRKDWQQHLQGVFWILRSRQIEVETSSLESTTWWAWLRQDIWVAFRERRRTYSTWSPKKPYSELSSYEVASRAVWILAQVINFCAVDPSAEETGGTIVGRIGWAKALKRLLQEWESALTIEFSELPVMTVQGTGAFKPRLIHPPCFGLAIQMHHVSKVLVHAHEPSHGGMEHFIARQETILDSLDVVCGIGTTITDDASSMLSSQCIFIALTVRDALAGMFLRDQQKRRSVLVMLDACRNRCGWPTPSLASDLEQIWENPAKAWAHSTNDQGDLLRPEARHPQRCHPRRSPGDIQLACPCFGWSGKCSNVMPPHRDRPCLLVVLAQSCFAGSLFGVDAGIIGGVIAMPDFKREFGFANKSPAAVADLQGNLVTTMQAGAVLGALVCSPVADRWGRKPSLLAVAVLGLVGALLQAFAYGHLPAFYIGRFIEGVGLGAGTMLAPTYVSENSPRAIRGFLVGFFQLLLVAGSMVAYFINYGSLLHLPPMATWMVPLAMQGICPILLFVSMLFCPESPRWLASQDRWETASAVLSDVRRLPPDHPYVQQELLELRTQLDQEAAVMQGAGFWQLQKECWTVASNRNRALLTIMMLTFNQWSGTGAINYYAPTIFRDLGLSSTTTALFAQGIYGVVKVVTCLIFVFFLADSLGRRLSLMWSGAVQGLCMFYLGFYVRFGPKIGTSETPPPAGIAALAMVYIFAAAFNMGSGPVCWIYSSEIPSNRMRAYNVALASLTHWIHNLAVTKATPVMLFATPFGAYFIFGSINFLMAVVAFWLPETKGVSLERMDEKFGATDMSNLEDLGVAAGHVEKKNTDLEEVEAVHTSKA
ncbi:hypothetical protein GE09DRAFT_971660 [Coniochaeta sp. 2T2.1]|nr:hypothetical protein GE09DRAFT_971660 [Coniochaeta sp. 2T2.1]